MTSPIRFLFALLATWLAASAIPGLQARTGGVADQNDLDAFMKKVLERREVNRQTLKQYILDESEKFEILGPGRWPLYRSHREFTWYLRDGVHVRSPLRFNGVGVGAEARDEYERRWLERERARQEREDAKRKHEQTTPKGEDAKTTKEDREHGTAGEPKGEVTVGPGGVAVSPPGVPTEPRFVSEAYFMDFKFEPGNYYLAGREQLEGKHVLRIEYYPTKMFGDGGDRNQGKESDARQQRTEDRDRRKDKELEDRIERQMNKTALVTLWVDPAEHQIVKYTFDNVWLDFLPGAWLVRVDEMRASMTMGQPFPGIWLPRGMDIRGSITLANGSYEAGYSRDFRDYREADVKSRLRVPRDAAHVPERPVVVDPPIDTAPEAQVSGPFVPEDAQTGAETVREVRVHGNAYLADADVIGLAGISVGAPLPVDAVETIRKRLEDTGRFESVDVRKRYRSLDDPTDVALVVVVHERPEIRSISDDPTSVLNPIRRVKHRLMFLPIVTYADGYGFTYGGRVSTVGLLGMGERLSVPLTWGGVRRAAIEFDRQFSGGPLTRVESSFGVASRQNPRFEIRDRRVELRGRAERVFADVLRFGVDASRSTIDFAALEDRLTAIGANAVVDTRGDPAYPSNAVLLSTGWTGLHFRSRPERVNRYTSEARGYLRVYRQAVLAARVLHVSADATLPPYERLLLGGSSTVRGFRTGAFDGDRLLATSAELRVPITSVLSGAKLGLTAFYDAGKTWDFNESRNDAEWKRGAGGGVFLIASIVRINLDVARAFRTGDTRVHASAGFTY